MSLQWWWAIRWLGGVGEDGGWVDLVVRGPWYECLGEIKVEGPGRAERTSPARWKMMAKVGLVVGAL